MVFSQAAAKRFLLIGAIIFVAAATIKRTFCNWF